MARMTVTRSQKVSWLRLRRYCAGLTLEECARASLISTARASVIERSPGVATSGELARYVIAIDRLATRPVSHRQRDRAARLLGRLGTALEDCLVGGDDERELADALGLPVDVVRHLAAEVRMPMRAVAGAGNE